MSEVLLRDLVSIPDEVHAGDFVLGLAEGVGKESTIADYVVTEQLAGCFDRALGLIRSGLETSSSRAAYLDGSFGSGKSHFMAVLYAILTGNPQARGKRGLADVVARHDSWLRGRKFLLVPYHLPDSQSLDAAILGGYVDHVMKLAPGTPLPAVYRDDELIADAGEMRAREGDDGFVALLSAAADEWSEPWDTGTLDIAFSQPPGGDQRRRLVGDLLAGPFRRYAHAVRAEAESFISLDEGLSVISQHAKRVLGYDAIVLLLDELVLWLSGYIGNPDKIRAEAQKVSKLVESAEYARPAPIISFVPRQRDLRDLVGRDTATAGSVSVSLFDILKYWEGRFDTIALDDKNLPMIVHERLLKPKDASASAELTKAFTQATAVGPQVWDTLLDVHGDASDSEAFRLTYPFSPAFLHAMVDISGALQRQRTALKLMQQLLVDYRDELPVGQLMPMGAIFDVLASGTDRPFTDKLRDEFDQAKRFYNTKILPHLLAKHSQPGPQAARGNIRFRADDLVVKTLLLAALVPNVPALRGLTASRLAALNHGSIVTMLPNRERSTVAKTLKDLSAHFGEIRTSGSEDDPRVDLALIGIDTDAILQGARKADDDAARRRVIKDMLWSELGLTDQGRFVTATSVIWRGTARRVEIVVDTIRDKDRLSRAQFSPEETGALRVVLNFPFDTGHYPAEALTRVRQLRNELSSEPTLVWLPHWLSDDRLNDLSTLICIDYALERDRLRELAPALTEEDLLRARAHLDSRRSALNVRLREALKRVYGVISPDEADFGARTDLHIVAFEHGFSPLISVGQPMKPALHRLCAELLTHLYPDHPDFDPTGKGVQVKPAELDIVLQAFERAANGGGRYEVQRNEIPTVRKIANPLKLGIMHEAAFTLGHEWEQLLDRKAGGGADVTVQRLRGWVADEKLGLPDQIRDLVVACYAAQKDKEWLQGGQSIDMPPLSRLTDDMVLRSPDLPTEEEFDRARDRAAEVFRIKREPVRTVRAVKAISAALQDAAANALTPVRLLSTSLDEHAGTLGLGEDSARLVTSRILVALLDRLTAQGNPTARLRVLADAELPKDNAIYRGHLASAATLAEELARKDWSILGDVASWADNGDLEAASIIGTLRRAASHDEHELALSRPLEQADAGARALMRSRSAPPPVPPDTPQPSRIPPSVVPKPVAGGDGSAPPARSGSRRVRGRAIGSVLTEIQAAAAANTDAEIEITWRIVSG